MKAREYVTDKGEPVYCVDIGNGVYCPYDQKFVSIENRCWGCPNYRQEAYGWLYCLRPLEEDK